jgi:chromosome segregation ATPase
VFPELTREVNEEDEVEEPEPEEEQDEVMAIQPSQSVASLGSNMQEVAQNLAVIAESFRQMRVTITHLDNSVNQLHHANAGYKEEMQTLKRNLSDINSYYSEFINALNTRVSKRD